ncbi:MAG: outer membrane beta-barrel protein [Deltaproteobacteria bacterium]|nr:outer membrane beta-barrel protein [Deltaproteobacteria bacterium]
MEEAASGEEEAEAPPRKPERPPEMPLMEPGFFPGLLPPTPYATLEVGPATGMLAPYGYPAAYDTLIRGWRYHRLGPVIVSPYLEYNGIYRSNIYQTSTDKKSDFINAIYPGLRLELPIAGRHKVSVGYLGNYFIYTDHHGDSHYDHNVNADVEINFRGGLSLRLGNTYRAATEERSSEIARQRDYERVNPYFIATYKISDKTKLQGSYQFDYLDFALPADRRNEYREHTGGVTFFYRFWPKTSLLLQYIITSREYPYAPEGDNLSHSPLIGLTWDPTAKLTGTVKFGYTVKNYDRDLPGRDNSPDSFAMSIQMLYRYSSFTNFSLTAQHSIQEDVDLAANNAYRHTAVYFSWNHDWHILRAKVYLAFSYTNNDYIGTTIDPFTGELKSREDDIISLGCGFSRPFTRWFRVRLDYQFLDRSSNIGGFTFNEHRFLFGIQASM